MKCLWCNLETTTNNDDVTSTIKFANKEHIFPEAVGGRKTLAIGKVCQDCNNRLGNEVDKYLKTENFMMLKQYQDSSSILGRPIGKIRNAQDKKRKKEEQIKIKGYSGGVIIKRYLNELTLTNLPDGSEGDFTYSSKFSKALHKCAINILLNEREHNYIKENYCELIDFVNNSQNESFNKWSYAVCYANMFSKVHFEPFCLQRIEIENVIHLIVLIFPCAIFVVGTKANVVDAILLNKIGSNPPKLENWGNDGFDYLGHFKGGFKGSRKTFGSKLKFTLIKNEIEGRQSPDDDLYHLLTKCKICGQTNPTRILLAKDKFLEKNHTSYIERVRNSWNVLTDEDLIKKGLVIDKWKEEDLESYRNHGIEYPKIYDVKNMNIHDCEVQCINCKHKIVYDAKDCFI